jgi:hypothetical protein
MLEASFTSKPVRTVELPEPSAEPLAIPEPDEYKVPAEPEPSLPTLP